LFSRAGTLVLGLARLRFFPDRAAKPFDILDFVRNGDDADPKDVTHAEAAC
jgi:hypothetical protein